MYVESSTNLGDAGTPPLWTEACLTPRTRISPVHTCQHAAFGRSRSNGTSVYVQTHAAEIGTFASHVFKVTQGYQWINKCTGWPSFFLPITRYIWKPAIAEKLTKSALSRANICTCYFVNISVYVDWQQRNMCIFFVTVCQFAAKRAIYISMQARPHSRSIQEFALSLCKRNTGENVIKICQ